MVDVNVNFVVTQEEPVRANFEVQPDVTYTAEIVTTEIAAKHNVLDNRDLPNQHPMGAITGLDEALDSKVDKVDDASKVYGTDENGDQTTYDVDSFGQVDDVQVGGVSVVTNKIAELGTMAGETASDYSTKSVADTLYAGISYESTIDNHIADKNNPHAVTKAQVGLGNCDNTSDDDKPVSTATQTALNGKQDTISDLSTIRENASHGESAYNTISGYGDIVTHNTSDFATSAQGTLADTALQPNDDISELVNDVGYITSASIPTNYVTTDTAQTITPQKAFSSPLVVADNNGLASGTILSNKKIIQKNSSGIEVGNSTEDILLVGKSTTTNPKYNGNDLALKSDIPTMTAGTGIDVTSNTISVTDPTLVNNGTGTKALAVGKTSQSTAEGGVAVGYGARANSTYGTAVGYESRANNTNTTAVGKQAKASNARSIAIGSGAEANADDAIAIKGINNTANTFQVYTYNMLDMSTGLIPDARINSSTFATKNYVDDSVSTNTAYFDGSWATYADIPSTVAGFTNESLPEPTNNNYLVVLEDETQDGGTWRYKYVDDGGAYDKANWAVEYEVNETPLTQAQLDALNSGVTSADVALAQSALQSGDNISELVNNSGYITGISSSDVTTALGYTPYNSTNPSGYISGITSSDVTTALGYTPADDSGVVKTTGNQTIAGTKSFSGNVTSTASAFKRTSAIDPTTTSGETEVAYMQVVDKNGSSVAQFNASRSTTTITNRQRAINTNLTGYNWYDARVNLNDAGQGSITSACGNTITNLCTAKVTNSTTENILASQGWVNNPATSTNVVHRSGDETVDGNKTFAKAIKATFAGGNTYNTSSNAAPYKKLASYVMTGTYQTLVVEFAYFRHNVDKASTLHFGKWTARVDGTAGTFGAGNSGVTLDTFPKLILDGKIAFYCLYRNNYPESNQVTVELWGYISDTWLGFSVIPIRQQTSGTTYVISDVTWYDDGTGSASLPAEYTRIDQSFSALFTSTPSTSDNSRQIATTAFVKAQGYATSSSLATVATSGLYSDLSGTPTIPTVDQTYDGTSSNAQSGIAIEGELANYATTTALATKQDSATALTTTNTYYSGTTLYIG